MEAQDLKKRFKVPKSGVIVTDPTLCHGCGICELACSLAHEGICSPAFSRIHISRDPLLGEIVQEICSQCFYPDCYFSCPFDAIIIDDGTGARVIVDEKCTNCGICARTCPLNAKGLVVKPNPLKNVYMKCDLCATIDKMPLCVEVCPWEALKYIPPSKRRF